MGGTKRDVSRRDGRGQEQKCSRLMYVKVCECVCGEGGGCDIVSDRGAGCTRGNWYRTSAACVVQKELSIP